MEAVDNNSDHNEVLDVAITYKIDGTYPSNSSKDRNRAIRKGAEWLEINKGELFLVGKNREQKVKIITEPEEQKTRNSVITIIQVFMPRVHICTH